MKQFRKFLLALMCVAVMGVVTACGSENNQTNDITDGTGVMVWRMISAMM